MIFGSLERARFSQAAREVFAKGGLESAGMNDIATASGLSKGALYLYYKGKDDLIAGLLKGLTLLWFTDPDAVQLETVLSTALRDFFTGLKG